MAEILSIVHNGGKILFAASLFFCLIIIMQLFRAVIKLLQTLITTLSPLENTVVQLEHMTSSAENISNAVDHALKQFKKSLDRAHTIGHILEFLHLKKKKRR